jgi:hypothetical protein
VPAAAPPTSARRVILVLAEWLCVCVMACLHEMAGRDGCRLGASPKRDEVCRR